MPQIIFINEYRGNDTKSALDGESPRTWHPSSVGPLQFQLSKFKE